MTTKEVCGLLALTLGLVVLGSVFAAADAPLEEWSNFMAGRFTDQTMWPVVIGTAAVFSGGAIALCDKRTT